MYQHPPLPNHVLPPHIRNHPLHVPCYAATGKVHPVHHGSRRLFGRYHYYHPERALQEAEHAQNGAMGEVVFHKERTQAVADEGAQGSADGAVGKQVSPRGRSVQKERDGYSSFDSLIFDLVLVDRLQASAQWL